MLFTRFWRDKVAELERKVQAQAEAIAASKARDREQSGLYAALLATHAEAIQSFKKLQEQYTDGLERARRATDEALAAQAVADTYRSEPLYLSEEEEDMQFQQDSGIINLEEYNRLLQNLDTT